MHVVLVYNLQVSQKLLKEQKKILKIGQTKNYELCIVIRAENLTKITVQDSHFNIYLRKPISLIKLYLLLDDAYFS